MPAERQTDTDEQDGPRRTLKRRGLIAGAAALVAGIVAAKTSEPVAAGTDGDLVLSYFSNAYATTGVQATEYNSGGFVGNWVGSPVFKGDASLLPDTTSFSPSGNPYNIDGIQGLGKGAGTGVVGNGGANSGIGVYGFGAGTAPGVQGFGGNVLGAPGVVGVANSASANNGDGVRGFGANGGVGVAGKGGASNATGVIGFGGGSGGQGVAGIGAATGPGIVGVGGNFGATNNADGVQGFANGIGTGVVGHGGGSGGTGVYGFATGGTGVRGQITGGAAGTIAVYGENMSTNTGGSPGNGGFGAYGFSAKGHGLVGATGTAGGGALVGATNGVAGAYAAIFYGPIAIVGAAKSAAVKNADGSHSLLYCEESPESWFADYGEGALVAGKAEVKIDPAFAAVADMSKYHVFLTPYANTNGLHVTGRSAQGFTVEEHNGGKNSLAFSYRVVGKRKDIEGKRLARVHLPPEPMREGLPATPAPAVPPTPLPASIPPPTSAPVSPQGSATPPGSSVAPNPAPLPAPRP